MNGRIELIDGHAHLNELNDIPFFQNIFDIVCIVVYVFLPIETRSSHGNIP